MNLVELFKLEDRVSTNKIIHLLGDNIFTEYNIDTNKVSMLTETNGEKASLVIYPERPKDLDSLYLIYSVKCPVILNNKLKDLIGDHSNIGSFGALRVAFKTNTILIFCILPTGLIGDIVEVARTEKGITAFINSYPLMVTAELKILLTDFAKMAA